VTAETGEERYAVPRFGFHQKQEPPDARGFLKENIFQIPGDVLLSHPVTRAVPSALEGLTAVFGMGTGVTPPLWSPRKSREESSVLLVERCYAGASVFLNQATRPISTGQLNTLPCFHLRPINLVVFQEPLARAVGLANSPKGIGSAKLPEGETLSWRGLPT
jgi:hypothetical protein